MNINGTVLTDEMLEQIKKDFFIKYHGSDQPDLASDLLELLIIAHRVPDAADRRAIADIAEKWLRKYA
jgi:hypothetical protein